MKKKLIIRRAPGGKAGAIGIIGGADGPTAIFVGGRTREPAPHPFLRFARGVACIAGIAAAICLGRAKAKRK